MTNNPTIDGVSRERAADSLYLTMWPNDTLHECDPGNPKWNACLRAVYAGYAMVPPFGERQEPAAWMYKRKVGEILGQLVQMESDDLKCIRLGKCHDNGTRYMWPREDYIEWKPLYEEPPEFTALQSTIAQLEDKLNKAIDLDFQRRETIADLEARVQELVSGKGDSK